VPRKPAPDFSGMTPDEGARQLLRYMFDQLDELGARLERIDRYFAPLYQMVYEMRNGAGTAPGPAQIQIPARLRGAAAAVGRAAARSLFERAKKAGIL